MRSWQALAIFAVLTPVFALDFPTSLNDVHQIVFGGTNETVNPESDPLTFDYIIVGGGTAGLVVASRLSENPSVKVAVIEAGSDYLNEYGPALANVTMQVNIPGFDANGLGSEKLPTRDINWGYETVPQVGCGNRVMQYARGKTLGGTSALNFMLYQRGTSSSYEQWANLTKDPSWSWESVLPYFQKSVQFTPPNDGYRQVSTRHDAEAFAEQGGPLQVSFPNTPQEFGKWAEAGLHAAGVKKANDFNSGTLDGVTYVTTTIDPKTGYRSSSRSSFLAAASGRSNLAVFTQTLAKRVIFDGKKAVGVEGTLTNETAPALKTFRARREVIVSSGVFGSPHILKVSGVGPKEELERHGIKVVADLPGVGGNMQDHVLFGPSHPVQSKPKSSSPHAINTVSRLAFDAEYAIAQVGNFSQGAAVPGTQLGPLTNPVADLIAFERIDDATLESIGASELSAYPAGWPHIEYLSVPVYMGDLTDLSNQPTEPAGQQYAGIVGALMAPLSRGVVNITSADTADNAQIDPNWFSHPVDQRVGVEIYKRVRKAFASAEIAPVLDGEELYPGSEVQSDEDILKTIQNSLITFWHATSTCSMGAASDPLAVLDSELRVRGVEGLRVIDAASFPTLPPGHPQSSIYMVAEKGSELIKKAYAEALI